MVILLVLLLLPVGALAQGGAGTWSSPYLVEGLPFAHRADTTVGVEMADIYSCAPNADESGPEVVYQLSLDRPGRVIAWVQGDVEATVDVDVHILDDSSVIAGEVSCRARGNRVAEAEVDGGAVWIVVDTFVDLGDALTGPFELRIELASEMDGVFFIERQVARGVLWRRETHRELFGGVQTINLLEVDITDPDVIVEPRRADGCETTAALGEQHEAVAAVNAGYFSARCEPVGVLRIDGDDLSTAARDRPPRAALGLAGLGDARVERVASGGVFRGTRNAVGGAPQLVSDGVADVTWREEGVGRSFTNSRHPRTAACVTGDDYLLFITFDGRTGAGRGVDLHDLADFLVSLGCDRGLNYDGGGSTTMWIWPRVGPGVVSFPADNRLADHRGQRPVASAWLVWAPPANRPPRFTTTPPTRAVVNEELVYDAGAMDLDLEPLQFSLISGPRGMSIAADDGVLRWTPRAAGPDSQIVVIGVSDGLSRTEQAFALSVDEERLDR